MLNSVCKISQCLLKRVQAVEKYQIKFLVWLYNTAKIFITCHFVKNRPWRSLSIHVKLKFGIDCDFVVSFHRKKRTSSIYANLKIFRCLRKRQ